jgi:hypothetical protein
VAEMSKQSLSEIAICGKDNWNWSSFVLGCIVGNFVTIALLGLYIYLKTIQS